MIDDLSESKLISSPVSYESKKEFQGLVLLDWDGTIVTKKNPKKFIDRKKTSQILKDLLSFDFDIHFVTSRINEKDTHDILLERLNELKLITEEYDDEFWLKRIHCTIKDHKEYNNLEKNYYEGNKILSQRKKTCTQEILKKPEYSNIPKEQVYFLDDNQVNCQCVGEIPKINVTHATKDGSHLDVLKKIPEEIRAARDLKIKNEAIRQEEIQAARNLKRKNEAIQQYYKKLNDCLDAMYPDRANWGDKPATNATGVKEIHRLIYETSEEEFSEKSITAIEKIVSQRLEKPVSCCSLFCRRDPLVQRLYTTLARSHIESVNSGLAYLLDFVTEKHSKSSWCCNLSF